MVLGASPSATDPSLEAFDGRFGANGGGRASLEPIGIDGSGLGGGTPTFGSGGGGGPGAEGGGGGGPGAEGAWGRGPGAGGGGGRRPRAGGGGGGAAPPDGFKVGGDAGGGGVGGGPALPGGGLKEEGGSGGRGFALPGGSFKGGSPLEGLPLLDASYTSYRNLDARPIDPNSAMKYGEHQTQREINYLNIN